MDNGLRLLGQKRGEVVDLLGTQLHLRPLAAAIHGHDQAPARSRPDCVQRAALIVLELDRRSLRCAHPATLTARSARLCATASRDTSTRRRAPGPTRSRQDRPLVPFASAGKIRWSAGWD